VRATEKTVVHCLVACYLALVALAFFNAGNIVSTCQPTGKTRERVVSAYPVPHHFTEKQYHCPTGEDRWL
jgi:hypothetical protein